MIELILDASQLELFEPCPRKYFYSSILNLIPNRSNRAYDKGSYFHEVLAHYYKTTPHEDRWQSSIDFAASNDLFNKYNIRDADERKFYRKRLIEYFTRYEDNDSLLEIIAVEQGFSWLLYEDSERRYILEGKIDLIYKDRNDVVVMDHKTQSRKDDKWPFNHQVCNYLSFTKANYFVYNYIGLQDSLPPDGMRRVPYIPHPDMLEQWKKEVKRTFDELYLYLKSVDETMDYLGLEPSECEGSFPRRRAACDSSKYGLCTFYKLCSVPDNSKWVPVVLSAYKENTERWKPW